MNSSSRSYSRPADAAGVPETADVAKPLIESSIEAVLNKNQDLVQTYERIRIRNLMESLKHARNRMPANPVHGLR
jgi:hypothetical protein